MIAKAKFLVLTAFFLALCHLVTGQVSFTSSIDTDKRPGSCKPPKNRELFHDYIDTEQKKILRSDGKNDNQYTPSADDEINFRLTQSLVNKVDWLQCKIENDSALTGQNKVRYLRGIENLLKFFASNTASKKVNPVLLPDIITAYENCMQNDKEGKSIEPIIKDLPYETSLSVVKADRTFEKNPGYKSSQNILVLKYCILHPDQIFLVLKDNPDVPFADSLIRTMAKKYPVQLYDYSQANNKLGNIIRNIKDDVFINAVARMARSKSGQQYFPFLDNIVNGKMTIEQIDSVQKDSIQYFKLLVKTQMGYVERMLNKDTAFAIKELIAKLEKKAKDDFITTINGMHDEEDDVRFKCIQPLNAEELYYLAVLTDGLIYTSSYTKGVYPLMMKKINGRGDSLLMLMNFDKYRKFIKMAAGYNTLSNFLTTFPNADDANNLLRAFVNNLERSDGLEDGVDVADSYASIAETIRPVAKEMLGNIQLNYQRNLAGNNKRGIAIYNILDKLFLSADTSNNIDLTKELGIPPVYEVPYKSLINDSGRVIMQVFIYGDKDGIGIFPGLMNMFSNANWKIDRSNSQWVVINSAKGKPVSIYLNRPLPEETDEDNQAQKALCAYLEKNKYYPTITINRGHSYNAPYTIEQMFSSSRIVFMGSCGGYRMIHDILEKAPDAHIIGTKQIADVPVNNPFLQLLTEKVRIGNNIDWIPFWQELDKMVTNKIFEDYVPPYKNLGALFIKAYKKAMGDGDGENQ